MTADADVRPDVPTFAVVGAVNHGKSSVVAALAEDDAVRVSSMPGETVTTKRFALDDLLVFFDTPGFQNARKTHALLVDLGRSGGAPLDTLRRFVAQHRRDPDFEAECRLLEPIVDGAAIVYVVDGSRPWRDLHGSEIDILAMTGAPRLALLHYADGAAASVADWRAHLAPRFDAVLDFDAHRATFGDRLALLASMARVAPAWADRLRRAGAAMTAERVRRIDDAATLIADLVIACVRHSERSAFAASMNREVATADLKRRYAKAVGEREHAGHRELIALYAHHHVVPDAMPASLFGADLFAEETWALFGLGTKQLVALSTVAGGVAGVGVDAALLGHSLGLGAVIGAAGGAGGAYLLGKRRPEFAIRWLGAPGDGLMGRLAAKSAIRVGGGDLVIGPSKAENFPWIVIDRALCLFAEVESRSHARRDETTAHVERALPRLDAAGLSVSHWPDPARAACQRAFRAARADRAPDVDEMAALRRAIRAALERIAGA